MTVMLPPVGIAQVGSLVVAVTVGAPEGALRVTFVVPSHEPATELLTVTVYEPSGTLLNTGDDWKLFPSIE